MEVRDEGPPESKNHAEDALPVDRSVTLKIIAPALSMAVGVVVIGLLARYLQSVFTENAETVLRLTLAIGALVLGVVMAVGHRRQWVLPSNQMRSLVHEIRMGRAPIEEFSKFNPGSLNKLADEVKLLLQDLRQQRQAVDELKEEVRLRIAHRETVLERTVAALRNQIVRDPLTSLFNRRMLEQLLPQLIAQCQGDHKDLTLMMIDIDHFKQFNSTLGPAAGDEVLKSIGQIIHSTIREGDVGCRYGGDEFVILLPGCTPEASKRVSNRLESLVQSLTETYKVAVRPRLSIGTSSLEGSPEPTATALLKRADDHLTKIKESRKQTATVRPPANAA